MRALALALAVGMTAAGARAQTPGGEGLPLPQGSQPGADLGAALCAATGLERVLGVMVYDLTAADVALLAAPDPQAALASVEPAAGERVVGRGVKVELEGLTAVWSRFQSEADALVHAGAFLQRGLSAAVPLPALGLTPGERPSQLIELAGHDTLLLWGPALDDPSRAAQVLSAARATFGLSAPGAARALLLPDHVQVTLLRRELPALLALREALEQAAGKTQGGELVEQREDLRVRLAVRESSGRLEITRADPERARALRELALPLAEDPPAQRRPGLVEGVQESR